MKRGPGGTAPPRVLASLSPDPAGIRVWESDALIASNTVGDEPGTGIETVGSAVTIFDNDVDSTGFGGIFVVFCDGVQLQHNRVVGTTHAGVGVQGSRDAVIEDNTVTGTTLRAGDDEDTSGFGIFAVDIAGGQITGNIVSGTASAGIVQQGFNNAFDGEIAIQANQVTGALLAGISVEMRGGGGFMTDNMVMGVAGTGIRILDSNAAQIVFQTNQVMGTIENDEGFDGDAVWAHNSGLLIAFNVLANSARAGLLATGTSSGFVDGNEFPGNVVDMVFESTGMGAGMNMGDPAQFPAPGSFPTDGSRTSLDLPTPGG
jgi:hypothetical protein